MNKNLLLATGLIALAVIVYMRKNKKPEITSVAPPKTENSNACGMCGANGENWN